MKFAGVGAGPHGVADHGVLVHPDQAASLRNATPFGEVLQHRGGLVRRQPGIEQRGTFAFGEAGLTSPAAEEAALMGSVAGRDGEVAKAPLAVVGASGILTAEGAEIVHWRPPWRCALPGNCSSKRH